MHAFGKVPKVLVHGPNGSSKAHTVIGQLLMGKLLLDNALHTVEPKRWHLWKQGGLNLVVQHANEPAR
jgi:hypothetical protein